MNSTATLTNTAPTYTEAPKPTMADLRTPDANRTGTPGTQMLASMGTMGQHIYAGTVDPEEVRRRRAANKRARQARAKARSRK